MHKIFIDADTVETRYDKHSQDKYMLNTDNILNITQFTVAVYM